MSAHTPGPWSYEVRMSNGNGWSEPRQFVEICAAGAMVAWYDTTSVEFPDSATNEANARLIAAAPDLLHALKVLYAEYKQLADSGDAGSRRLEEQEEGQITLAAIAKATGEGNG